MKNLMKVVSCGEMFTVRSEKAEGGVLNKRMAQTVFYPGEYVWAALRFQTREYNGQVFQDITALDIIKVIN